MDEQHLIFSDMALPATVMLTAPAIEQFVLLQFITGTGSMSFYCWPTMKTAAYSRTRNVELFTRNGE